MTRCDALDLKGCDLLQGRQDRASVWLHQAVIVQRVMRQKLLHSFSVHDIFRAVVHAECVASEEQPGPMVEREHSVRPVEIGGDHKLEHMPTSKVDLVVVSHDLALEGRVHQCFEVHDANLGAHYRQLLVAGLLGQSKKLEHKA
eukprot:CAMPEP_0115069928 /NCGR_PEP_ID=MMETSP0227-20121206/12827_1 /TAXON_ID=89957 /ORGANISM="Polarella glacialis, Strain CCMP 1383" /LENGTH=143 /DNA_ID=CAMNT_0002456379 /DNA_START=416 /DNA_END=847 /DNA_ORIENTATION=+